MGGSVHTPRFAGRQPGQERRQIARSDSARIGARGMQERPARTVDTAHDRRIERHDVAVRCRIVRIDVQRSSPAAPEARHAPAAFGRLLDDGLDA
jgi:hypothetical protein